MDEASVRQRLIAILCADAAGFSRLMAGDEHATLAALDAARGLFERCGAPRMVEACHRMSLDAMRAAP